MPQSRQSQISLIDTPYYHCVSRCVRQAYLCGEDKLTGKSYEHRRDWVEDRLLFLGRIFAIDICAYAVMNNHTHVVLHVDKEEAESWSSQQVLTRYHTLHKGTLLTHKYLSKEVLSPAEQLTVETTISIYRQRLYDISWFMRELNEYIARQANQEDGCTGRFWEGRFKSQALLDEAAVLSCMAYVDLNPVRAKIEKAPDTSKHTSIFQRVKAIKEQQSQPCPLMPFSGSIRQEQPKSIHFALKDYCELVDTTGRYITEGKRGYIAPQQGPILERLGLSDEQWLILTQEFETQFCYAAGAEQMMQEFKSHTHHKRLKGMRQAKALFSG